MKNLSKCIAVLAAFLVVVASYGQAVREKLEVTLHVGDSAPALATGEWLKGEPVKGFEAGNVYVVEFWASWCGPCKMSIPHLTKLQAEYKDKGVIIIGQNCWERSVEAAKQLLEQMGDKMNYRVALDDTKTDEKGVMAKTWMSAAGQMGIPSSFVVDKKGKIAWIGHPMSLDKVLPGVLDGTFDAQKLAAQERLERDKWDEFGSAMRGGDAEKALAALDVLQKMSPDSVARIEMARLDILHRTKKAYDASRALATKLASELFSKDGAALMRIAALLTNGTESDKESVKLAQQILDQASKLNVDADEKLLILKLQAKIWATQGQYEKAIEAQSKVVDGITGPRKRFEERTLQEYKDAAAAAKAKSS